MMKYKISKVNNVKYLQIWDNGEFKLSCGSANKLYKKLVRLSKLEVQTKTYAEFQTKILRTINNEKNLNLRFNEKGTVLR